MDKQIIKALYGVASKDNVNPILNGVHFEEQRCYATDTHLLVIYNEGSEKHAGKTLSIKGEEIKGQYPPVDKVIPKKLTNPLTLDFGQLQRACAWWGKQSDHHIEDKVVLRSTCLNIAYLQKVQPSAIAGRC